MMQQLRLYCFYCLLVFLTLADTTLVFGKELLPVDDSQRYRFANMAEEEEVTRAFRHTRSKTTYDQDGRQVTLYSVGPTRLGKMIGDPERHTNGDNGFAILELGGHSDTEAGKPIARFTLSKDGNHAFVIRSNNDTSYLWVYDISDLEAFDRREWISKRQLGSGTIGAVELSPDGKQLALTVGDRLRIYDTDSLIVHSNKTKGERREGLLPWMTERPDVWLKMIGANTSDPSFIVQKVSYVGKTWRHRGQTTLRFSEDGQTLYLLAVRELDEAKSLYGVRYDIGDGAESAAARDLDFYSHSIQVDGLPNTATTDNCFFRGERVFVPYKTVWDRASIAYKDIATGDASVTHTIPADFYQIDWQDWQRREGRVETYESIRWSRGLIVAGGFDTTAADDGGRDFVRIFDARVFPLPDDSEHDYKHSFRNPNRLSFGTLEALLAASQQAFSSEYSMEKYDPPFSADFGEVNAGFWTPDNLDRMANLQRFFDRYYTDDPTGQDVARQMELLMRVLEREDLGGFHPFDIVIPSYSSALDASEEVNPTDTDFSRILTSPASVFKNWLAKLAHPNGVCAVGSWEIFETSETDYTGYFENGAKARTVVRISSATDSVKTPPDLLSLGYWTSPKALLSFPLEKLESFTNYQLQPVIYSIAVKLFPEDTGQEVVPPNITTMEQTGFDGHRGAEHDNFFSSDVFFSNLELSFGLRSGAVRKVFGYFVVDFRNRPLDPVAAFGVADVTQRRVPEVVIFRPKNFNNNVGDSGVRDLRVQVMAQPDDQYYEIFIIDKLPEGLDLYSGTEEVRTWLASALRSMQPHGELKLDSQPLPSFYCDLLLRFYHFTPIASRTF